MKATTRNREQWFKDQVHSAGETMRSSEPAGVPEPTAAPSPPSLGPAVPILRVGDLDASVSGSPPATWTSSTRSSKPAAPACAAE